MTEETTPDTEQIDVAYVAHLARMELTEDETREFQGQLRDIVGYVRKLNEVDLTGVEPTAHAVPIRNVFREDEPHDGLDRQDVLENAPATVQDQFLVPKIVE